MTEQAVGTEAPLAPTQNKILCIKIRPKGESGWLSMPLTDLAAAIDLIRGATDDEDLPSTWEMETFMATQSELDAAGESPQGGVLPALEKFDGW